MKQRFAAIPLLMILVLSQAGFLSCGKAQDGFVAGLKIALVASPAFLDSLGLSDKRQAVADDFLTLGNNAVTFSDEVKACTANPCRVEAVNRFQTNFWNVLRGGHFKLSPKLERIQKIIQGIIDSARIYYGGSASTVGNAPTRVVTEADLKSQLEELKAALKP